MANATATAAMVPVWITSRVDQPKTKPIDGPYASRRKTYCPPARGIIAATSAAHGEPKTVSSPASAQASISQPGAPRSLRDVGRDDEDARPDHRPDADHRRVERPEPALELGFEAGGASSITPSLIEGTLRSGSPGRERSVESGSGWVQAGFCFWKSCTSAIACWI